MSRGNNNINNKSMSNNSKLTPKQNSNLRQNQNQSRIQPQIQSQQAPQAQEIQQEQEIEQSPNQLTLAPEVQKALEAIKKKRAERSPFMKLEAGQTYTLLFNPAKMHVEQKTFNGQNTERISHTVIDLDNREAGEKVLSLTYKQSMPIEQAMEQGYTVMRVTKIGEGFELAYSVEPIE